jgi:carbon monoxide dehydrogenase subunit G
VAEMLLDGKYELEAPRQKVWEFIIEPSKIGKCLPDLKSLEVESEDKFLALIRVGVGPIKSDFKFRMEILEKEPASRLRLKAVGTGSGGNIIVDTTIELGEIPTGTELSYRSDVNVGGMMASLGQRLISDTAEKIVAGIFECIKKQME